MGSELTSLLMIVSDLENPVLDLCNKVQRMIAISTSPAAASALTDTERPWEVEVSARAYEVCKKGSKSAYMRSKLGCVPLFFVMRKLVTCSSANSANVFK